MAARGQLQEETELRRMLRKIQIHPKRLKQHRTAQHLRKTQTTTREDLVVLSVLSYEMNFQKVNFDNNLFPRCDIAKHIARFSYYALYRWIIYKLMFWCLSVPW